MTSFRSKTFGQKDRLPGRQRRLPIQRHRRGTVLTGIYLCQNPHPAFFGNGPDGFDPVRLQPAVGCQAGVRQVRHAAGRYSFK